MKTKRFIPNAMYRWKRGNCLGSNPPFDKYDKRYRFLKATDYNNCGMGDCWVVDEKGNLHPGYNISPIPIDIDSVVKL